MLWFSRALYAKIFWRGLFNTGLWRNVIKSKYLNRMSSTLWFRNCSLNQWNVSAIWNNFLKSYLFINQAIAWSIRHGILVNIGLDPIVGLHDGYKLSTSLISELRYRNIVILKQALKEGNFGLFHWLPV